MKTYIKGVRRPSGREIEVEYNHANIYRINGTWSVDDEGILDPSVGSEIWTPKLNDFVLYALMSIDEPFVGPDTDTAAIHFSQGHLVPDGYLFYAANDPPTDGANPSYLNGPTLMTTVTPITLAVADYATDSQARDVSAGSGKWSIIYVR